MRRLAVLVLAVMVLGAACAMPAPSWPQFRHDASGSGSAPAETQINAGNVGSLVLDYTAPGPAWVPGGGAFPPSVAVVGNRVYTGSGTLLAAYDALGAEGCGGSPKQCSPLWTGTLPGTMSGAPAVANGVVYATSLDVHDPYNPVGQVVAFDAAGVQGCSGSPAVCQPLWMTPAGGQLTSPIVANGSVYGQAADGVVAYDAAGVLGCSGVPKLCQPVWSGKGSASSLVTPLVAVAGGVLIARHGGFGTIAAFDAKGVTNCSGTPTVCAPLWEAIDNTQNFFASVTIAGQMVFAGSGGRVVGYDLNGVNGCSGAPVVCVPIWSQGSTDTDLPSSPAVAGTTLFIQRMNGMTAFDTSTVPCIAPACTATFFEASGMTPHRQALQAPTVANGVVFTGDLHAYDANRSNNCQSTQGHWICSPLWHYDLVDATSPAVVGGRLYANAYGTLYVFKLP